MLRTQTGLCHSQQARTMKPAYRIQQRMRHKSADTTTGYIRAGEQWTKSGLKGFGAWPALQPTVGASNDRGTAAATAAPALTHRSACFRSWRSSRPKNDLSGARLWGTIGVAATCAAPLHRQPRDIHCTSSRSSTSNTSCILGAHRQGSLVGGHVRQRWTPRACSDRVLN